MIFINSSSPSAIVEVATSQIGILMFEWKHLTSGKSLSTFIYMVSLTIEQYEIG